MKSAAASSSQGGERIFYRESDRRAKLSFTAQNGLVKNQDLKIATSCKKAKK
jgi:hypothetical protein